MFVKEHTDNLQFPELCFFLNPFYLFSPFMMLAHGEIPKINEPESQLCFFKKLYFQTRER